MVLGIEHKSVRYKATVLPTVLSCSGPYKVHFFYSLILYIGITTYQVCLVLHGLGFEQIQSEMYVPLENYTG